MNNKNLIIGIAFSFLLSTASAHAVEIKIIDKTYDEDQIRYSRTLQSDLDSAEQVGKSYDHTATQPTPPKRVATPVTPAPTVTDPVYSAPPKADDTTTLRDDLDEGVVPPPTETDDSLTIDTDRTVPQNQSNTVPASPLQDAEPQTTVPPVQKLAPPPAKPTLMEDETMAPTEREPILLGNMSDESLKKELGISETPAEADIQPEAGVEENFSNDAAIITAPPAQALPSNTTSNSYQ